MMSRNSNMKSWLGLLFLTTTALASKTDAINTCLTLNSLQTRISTDETWTNDTASFQFRLPREPIAIAHPTSKNQVALALSCARNASVPVRALGRAHSFQGYGFGDPGNLIIDMSSFTHLTFDNSTKHLTFGGGANVGPTAKFLWDNHQRHFPHVRGSHVGLAGSSMGGGYGTTSRFLGIPTDNLVSVEFMLANGSIVTAGPRSDLLWAAKGAGPSFGIVLEATTKTFEVPVDGAVSYSLSLGDVSVDTASEALVTIQKWVVDGKAPDEMSLRYSVADFSSAGFFYGAEEAFDKAVKPLVEALRGVAPKMNLTKKVLPFWDSEAAAVGPGMNDPVGGALGGRASLVQSWVVTNEHPLTRKQAKALLESYHSLNRTDITGTGFLDLWGGVSRDISDGDTAFAHGNNLWLVRVDGVASSGVWPSDGNAYMQGLMKPFESSLKKSAPLRSFVNYVNSELSVKEWSSRLYGAKNFKRLRELKGEVDPENVFSGYGLAIPAK